MDFNFTVDTEAATTMTHGGGKLTTGVHNVVIEEAYLKASAKGDRMIDLQIRSKEGAVGFISNMCIDKTWKSGSENFNYKELMEFITAAGATNLTGVACKRKKGEEEMDAMYSPELKGKELKVAVYVRYDVYNNEETEALTLSASFLANGKTPTEEKNGVDAKAVYKVSERLADFHTPAWKTWNEAKGMSAEAGTSAPTDAQAQAKTAETAQNLFA